MDKIEKALFLKIRQYQFLTSDHSEIAATYGQMSEDEKGKYVKLSRELHEIYNYINSPPILNVRPDDGVNSVQAYHDKINPVSDIILKVLNDFNFTLKDTMTKSQKAALIAILGEDYFKTKYGDIKIIDDL